MGTYDDSKIRVARKPKRCKGCGGFILQGSRYLDYRAGLRNQVVVCLICAYSRLRSGGLAYRCAAIEPKAAT